MDILDAEIEILRHQLDTKMKEKQILAQRNHRQKLLSDTIETSFEGYRAHLISEERYQYLMYSPLDFGGSVPVLTLIHPGTYDQIEVGYYTRRQLNSLAIWDDRGVRFVRDGLSPRDQQILNMMITMFPKSQENSS